MAAPVDHLPFPTPDLEGLAEALRRLGFTVSPRGRYSDPEGADYPNRCVFTRKGWFDLLQVDEAPAGVLPRGCLFLADELDAAREALAALEPSRRTFLLERRWDADIGRPPERFRWIGVKTRRLSIQVAVIEHAWPCADMLPDWQAHPNGAVEVLGLALAAEPPGETGLDTSGFRFLSAEALQATYGAERAVRVRVASLSQADDVLSGAGLAIRRTGERLVVLPHGPFACAFEFTETAGS